MERLFANNDIRRHIFSFGYPEHRERMKTVALEITIDADYAQTVRNTYYERGGDRSIMEYLRDEYTAQELVEHSKYLNRCKCCTRHSHCKPYVECVDNAEYVRIPENSQAPSQHVCSCPCRSMSRRMLKVYGYYYLDDDTFY